MAEAENPSGSSEALPIEDDGSEDQAKKPKKKHKVGKILGIVGIVIALLLIVEFAVFSMRVSIAGDADVMLTNCETYDEQGASASLYCLFSGAEPIAKDVNIAVCGTVDWAKPGDYAVTYVAQWGMWFGWATRTVHVVDTAPPVITLVEDLKHHTLPGEAYEEAGYTAIDDYDGDVTANVERVEENGVVTYTVRDAAGNEAVATREIRYYESEPPSLVLKGDVEMTVGQGGQYIEPGYEAIDNADGDLTANVRVEGTVDPETLGDYTLTYTVADYSENVTTVERYITVVPAGEKVVYLTFDDGPSSYTAELLDILAENGVKATFFVTGRGDASLIAREAAEGHAVGIHSLTHDYETIYESEDAYFADLNAMQAIIVEQTGKRASIIRFPGGSSNTVSSFNPGIMTALASAVQEAGYQYFDWNVSSGDAGSSVGTDEVFDNVTSGIAGHNVSVVLQHDTKEFSIAAVARIIQWGKENGYVFGTLDSGSPVCHHGINN